MKMSEVMRVTPARTDPTVKQQIIEAINAEPGQQYGQIERRLRHIPRGSISSTLWALHDQGKIKRKTLDGRTRYYAVNYVFSNEMNTSAPSKDQAVCPHCGKVYAKRGMNLHIWRTHKGNDPYAVASSNTAKVTTFLHHNPKASALKVGMAMGLKPRAVNNILSRLYKKGEFERETVNGNYVYWIKSQNPQTQASNQAQTPAETVVAPASEEVTAPASKALGSDFMQLAKDYFWETQDNDLRKFVEWVKHGSR